MGARILKDKDGLETITLCWGGFGTVKLTESHRPRQIWVRAAMVDAADGWAAMDEANVRQLVAHLQSWLERGTFRLD